MYVGAKTLTRRIGPSSVLLNFRIGPYTQAQQSVHTSAQSVHTLSVAPAQAPLMKVLPAEHDLHSERRKKCSLIISKCALRVCMRTAKKRSNEVIGGERECDSG